MRFQVTETKYAVMDVKNHQAYDKEVGFTSDIPRACFNHRIDALNEQKALFEKYPRLRDKVFVRPVTMRAVYLTED